MSISDAAPSDPCLALEISPTSRSEPTLPRPIPSPSWTRLSQLQPPVQGISNALLSATVADPRGVGTGYRILAVISRPPASNGPIRICVRAIQPGIRSPVNSWPLCLWAER